MVSLEVLKRIKMHYVEMVKKTKYPRFTDLEKERFEQIEKELKALEIIRRKNVETSLLIECEDLARYNTEIDFCEHYLANQLTQEEYDLLKEVLGNERQK